MRRGLPDFCLRARRRKISGFHLWGDFQALNLWRKSCSANLRKVLDAWCVGEPLSEPPDMGPIFIHAFQFVNACATIALDEPQWWPMGGPLKPCWSWPSVHPAGP
jgi:hypothetical protein